MPQPSPPELEVVYRSCPLCEAHCGIRVEVDRAADRVVAIRGDDADPMSHGYICPKAYGLKGLHEDPERLRRPIRRRNGDWEEIGWDEALEFVAGRLREIRERCGTNAIATYLGNPNAHDIGSVLYVPPFQRALGTRWRFSATSVDQLPKSLSCALLFGSPFAFPIPDVDRTGFFLILGANPLASNGSLMTAPDMPGRLRRLRERGGRLVVVDPRRSETARIADRHLFIRPGSDALFLLAMVHTLFEEDLVRPGRLVEFTRGIDRVQELARGFAPEAVSAATGIEAPVIRGLAREFAAAPSAVCYGRVGTCTQEFGTLASWAVDVLNVLTGNLDRPGGALFPRMATGPADDAPRRRGQVPFGRWRSRVRGLPEFAGELPVAALAEEIDSAGPEAVRALVTVAGNPILSTPNGARLAKALESLEFMVSIDIYLNETTRFADVILPPASQLERSNYDLVFTGVSVRNMAKWSPTVCPKPADAKEHWEILCELAGRLNGVDAGQVDDLVFAHLLSNAVGRPGSSYPDVSEEEARRKIGDRRGPERLLDLMLRAGPYGDHFQDGAEGLSLTRLQQAEHGIDLGPLEPRLPAMLATESGSIELAPEPIVQDVERLRAALTERARGNGLLLVGRRHTRNNNSWMQNVHALAKGRDRCTLLVHPEDAARLGLFEGASARIRSRAGEVVAPVVVSDEMMPGVVSLPHGYGHAVSGTRLSVARAHPGVNSNLLSDEAGVDALSGNAILNGIPVEVAPVTG